MNVILLGSNTKEEIENNLRIVASAGAYLEVKVLLWMYMKVKMIIRKIYVLQRE